MKKQPAVQNEKEIQKSQKNIELKGLLFIAAGLFLLASYAGLPTGFVGEFLHEVMSYGFGLGAIIFPFIFILLSVLFICRVSSPFVLRSRAHYSSFAR